MSDFWDNACADLLGRAIDRIDEGDTNTGNDFIAMVQQNVSTLIAEDRAECDYLALQKKTVEATAPPVAKGRF